MIGVVVWSNEKRGKAVIWCEDQGALAYLEGVGNLAAGAGWPVAGDLVEMESVVEGGLRLARAVRLLSQGAGAALPQALRDHAEGAAPALAAVAGDGPRLRLVSDRGEAGCDTGDAGDTGAGEQKTAQLAAVAAS